MYYILVNSFYAYISILAGLGRGPYRHGKRMNRTRQLFGKDLVNQTLAFQKRPTVEPHGHDLDPKMRFPTRARTAMALMAVGFIDHRQTLGRQCLFQLPRNRRRNRTQSHIPSPIG